MSKRPISKAELEAYIADEFIPAMRKRLPVIATLSEWRPIETAPKDGTWIMCKVEPAHHGWEDCIVLRYRGNEWGRPGMVGYKPTHWMPLPKPPAQ